MSFLRELWQRYLNGNTLTRLLFTNAAMFIFIIAVKTIAILLLVRHADMTEHVFQFHWDWHSTLLMPWTVVTAMFTSHGIWHMLFNMLSLYWFGTVFLQYFNNSTLRGVYVLGALASMISFAIPFYVAGSFPERFAQATFPAASGGILTIATVLAFKAPDHAETLPFIGPLKNKFLTLALIMVDIALFPEGNPATDLAHLGAFLTGYLYVYMLRKGTDMAKPVTMVAIKAEDIARALYNKVSRYRK